jgi:hypothetical protein
MLNTLTNPGHAAFFHHHQDDPGYVQWRTEAEKLAQNNPELRDRLDRLDAELAQMGDQPRDPNYLPPDISPQQALADRASDRGSEGDGGFILPAILVIGAGIVFLGWLKRHPGGRRPASSGGTGSMDLIKRAGDILRQRHSGETYKPALFRVGMVLPVDPTPFILAEGSTKVQAPEGSRGQISVAAVSTLADGPTTLHRLYLPEEQGFLQLHLNTAGLPDECRYFSRIDEVYPADAEEWGFWLDAHEGMIGWPEFQTKDGKLYARVWAPGASRVPPHQLFENGDDAQGTFTRIHQAMLYGAPTGVAPPAPQTEYLLVAAVERAREAWVEIHAGIDVNPASLNLA